MATPSRNRAIEGLRGFSAMLVLLYHAYQMSVNGGYFEAITTPWFVSALGKVGHYGVMLFFFISGYLIVKSLVDHADVLAFLKNRAIRIYPAFLVLHVVIFVAGPWAGYRWLSTLDDPVRYLLHFASNALFLPGILDLPLAQKNAWSLSYEAAFYLAASLFYASWSMRRTRPVTGAALAAVALAGSAVILCVRPYASFFLVGILAYGTTATVGPWMAHRSRHAAGLVFLLASFVCFDVSLLGSMLFGFAFFTTVVHEVGWFTALLRTRALQHLGRISYSLYLVHPFVLDPLRRVVRSLSHEPSGWWLLTFVAAGTALSIVVAGLSYRYLEGTLGRMLRATPRARRHPAPAPALLPLPADLPAAPLPSPALP